MFRFRLEQIIRYLILVVVGIVLIVGLIIFINSSEKKEADPIAVVEPTSEPTPTQAAPTSIVPQKPDVESKSTNPNLKVSDEVSFDTDNYRSNHTLSEGEFFTKRDGSTVDQLGNPVYINPDWNYDQNTGKSTIVFD